MLPILKSDKNSEQKQRNQILTWQIWIHEWCLKQQNPKSPNRSAMTIDHFTVWMNYITQE